MNYHAWLCNTEALSCSRVKQAILTHPYCGVHHHQRDFTSFRRARYLRMRLRSSVAFSSMVAAVSAAAGATLLSSRTALLLPAAVHAACSHVHHTLASRCGNMNLSQA